MMLQIPKDGSATLQGASVVQPTSVVWASSCAAIIGAGVRDGDLGLLEVMNRRHRNASFVVKKSIKGIANVRAISFNFCQK